MAIDVGDVHRLSYDHYVAGSLVSAAAATWTVRLPDGTTSSFPATPTSPGAYRNDYPVTQPGPHAVRWVGTGANAGTWSDTFDARPANPASLISLTDARKALRYDETAFVGDDEEIRLYIEAATWAVENHLRRAVVRREITDIAHGCRGARQVMLDWHPVLALTSVTRLDAPGTWDVGTLRVEPSGRVTTDGPRFDGDVEFVYVAGDLVVGGNILAAARIIVKHLWQVNQGSQGASRWSGMDDSMSVGWAASMGYALPNRAIELLGGRPPMVG